MLNNLLFYRLLITNGFALALFVWAYLLGYVDLVLERDGSGISLVMLALFVIGVILAFIRGIKVSKAIDKMKDRSIFRIPILAARKMPAKNKIVLNIAEYLVMLGLIGNAIGFFIALNHAGDGDNQRMAAALLAGMGVAFGSTLVGTITGLILWINYSMIEKETAVYLVEAEHHSR